MLSDSPDRPLHTIAMHFLSDACPALSSTDEEFLQQVISDYIDHRIPYSAASGAFDSRLQTTSPLERLREILEVPEDPLPPYPFSLDLGRRQISRPWTHAEDCRLLAGVHRHGLANWSLVAAFVGNGRSRSQCGQRWVRGLDPRISRRPWTFEEEQALARLVAAHGEKSWIRVSQEIGTRSDVQCRYHYMQMQREHPHRAAPEEQQTDNIPLIPIVLLDITPDEGESENHFANWPARRLAKLCEADAAVRNPAKVTPIWIVDRKPDESAVSLTIFCAALCPDSAILRTLLSLSEIMAISLIAKKALIRIRTNVSTTENNILPAGSGSSMQNILLFV
jgi:hypothetical protein